MRECKRDAASPPESAVRGWTRRGACVRTSNVQASSLPYDGSRTSNVQTSGRPSADMARRVRADEQRADEQPAL